MIYTDLFSAVMALHNDAEIEQSIPTFIALAEAQMNRQLRCREMWGFTTLNTACERAPLPADFLAVESIKGAFGKLTYVSPQMMDEMDHHAWGWTAGAPFQHRHEYTIAGGEIVFPYLLCPSVQPPACPARMRYRKRLSPISQANPTNWCLTNNPDAYVYGTLVQSLSFKADDRGEAWQAGYDRALAAIEDADRYVVEDILEMKPSFGEPRRHDHWRN